MTELEAYRTRFVDIREGLNGEVNRGIGLIDELLKELNCTKTELEQTKLDLDSECDARRRLQQENNEWKQRQERRPFVVALIDADADGYIFQDKYIVRAEKGGEDAADALMAAMQRYVREVIGAPVEMDVLVRAYANVGGLGQALERDRRLEDISQLRAFAAGFSNRKAYFDFIDVGPGKERADLKIQGKTLSTLTWPPYTNPDLLSQRALGFFLESFQCKHLVVACGHDKGYAPFLGQFVGDKQLADRITFLEGSPFPPVIRDLGFKTTRFGSVFNEVTQPVWRASLAGPAWGRVATSTASGTLVNGNSNVEEPTVTVPWAPTISLRNPKAQSKRLGPVLKSESGHRVDRRLYVGASVVERIKRESLCYYFFLRGGCDGSCRRNHGYRPLSDEEFDALWHLARRGFCWKHQKAGRDVSNDCSDVMCVYGHGRGDWATG